MGHDVAACRLVGVAVCGVGFSLHLVGEDHGEVEGLGDPEEVAECAG